MTDAAQFKSCQMTILATAELITTHHSFQA